MSNVQHTRKGPLIDMARINDIGGLEDPDIRRILGNFIEDLPGYLSLIELQVADKKSSTLLTTLHKLAGASRTCGFSGIDRAVSAWIALSKPFNARPLPNLRAVVEASVVDWHALDA
jgi:hypothetical protein